MQKTKDNSEKTPVLISGLIRVNLEKTGPSKIITWLI